MPNLTPPKLVEIATAAGLDLVRYYKENIRPVGEEPADAPEEPYWPDTSDLDAKAGCEKAQELRFEPTKNRIISGTTFQGWHLADGFWIGRYRSDVNEDWAYCAGQNWDDIWQG